MALVVTQKHKLYLAGAGVVLLCLVLNAEKKSEADDEDGGSANPGTICRMVVDADVLNVRSEASKDAPIVGTLTNGQEVTAEDKKDNGFRKLSEGRWAFDKYLHQADTSEC